MMDGSVPSYPLSAFEGSGLWCLHRGIVSASTAAGNGVSNEGGTAADRRRGRRPPLDRLLPNRPAEARRSLGGGIRSVLLGIERGCEFIASPAPACGRLQAVGRVLRRLLHAIPDPASQALPRWESLLFNTASLVIVALEARTRRNARMPDARLIKLTQRFPTTTAWQRASPANTHYEMLASRLP